MVVEETIGAAVAVAGYVATVVVVWVREHHRRRRVLGVVERLSQGSRYIDAAEGVLIEFGSIIPSATEDLPHRPGSSGTAP
jgi:hypothetical protein